MSVVNLVRAWSEVIVEAAPLWIVTRGTQSISHDGGFEPISMGQTLVWGAGRVLFNEYPPLRCKLIDLSGRLVRTGASVAGPGDLPRRLRG